jgi:adenylate cyclase
MAAGMPGEGESENLSSAELAARADATEDELERMVTLGILVPRQGRQPFLSSDVQKVRLAKACESSGLPLDAIGRAIEQGRVSFAFLEATPFRRWAQRSARTYRDVCKESGVPFDFLRNALEAFGFARMRPDDRIREDELDVLPLVRQSFVTGILDEAWLSRIGRANTQGLWRVVMAWADAYHARFEMSPPQAGLEDPQVLEGAARAAEAWEDYGERALMAGFRRQQELVWIEQLVERIEAGLEQTGFLAGPERVPAMVFLDLVGYTRLTEERGDEAAAELAEALGNLVERFSRGRGGTPVKWLGDGVMFHFRDPAGAVASALEMVEEVPKAGLPPAHVGVAAGPVITQGGDYFGRTVNLASRIAERAGAGQVLVSESVADSASIDHVKFDELGEARLKGFSGPVMLFKARPS